ncbi:PPOX class F420-dependent oxidoreductase [Kribbella monticola]|uniref:PPOX class F420-dependent oxidoreductase n=1 Tax=Kribbella monticola TaxID=2185285 RepID=UPI000DD2F591|nr:PPOX class F420-dependent oxidoreductase [Kribbella monticola]
MTMSEAARELIDGANTAVLATIDPDGTPQTSVVWVGRDGDDVLISTTAGLRKVANLQENPQASLLILDAADSSHYVEIRGTATITDDPDRQLAVQISEKYQGPGAGAEYLALPPEVVRVAIRITPTKVRVRT